MDTKNFFDQIWKQYISLNPDALKIHQLLEAKGEDVINDHVAYRTLKHDKLGIGSLSKFFEDRGYEQKSDYHFELKKLYAIHMEHKTDPTLPKVFISELLLEKFSDELQAILTNAVDQIPSNLIQNESLCIAGRPWTANFKTYEKLYDESEYAAWFYAYGFCANHFTVNVNSLKSFQNINQLNEFLIKSGFSMNSSGGLIKGSQQDYLEQSSTMAFEKEVLFSDGAHTVPSCYYEFAKRYKMDNGQIYQGFVAKSADKIFESTNKRN